MRHTTIWMLILTLVCCGSVVFGAENFLETVANAEKGAVVEGSRMTEADRLTEAARRRLSAWRKQQSYHDETSALMKSVYQAVSKPVGWFDVVKLPPTPASLATASLQLIAQYIQTCFGITLTSSDATQFWSRVGNLANWTQQQALRVYELLYKLPKFFTQATKKLARVPTYRGITNILGYVYSSFPTVTHICNSAVRTVALFQETIVHEMTHCFQFTNRAVMSQWANTFWKNNKPVTTSPTSYGNTNAYEDFAESVRLYVAAGKALMARDRSRYEFIRKYVMQGVQF